MKNPKLIRYSAIIIVIFFLTTSLLAFLFQNGIFIPNYPNANEFPVRGVDVSSYQGDIDWVEFSKNDIDFAYIKATEGSSFTDPKFLYNWEHSKKTDLKIGAYHFLSFESSGKTQAQNFIKNVPYDSESLPPVVDIEFYGDYISNRPSKAEVNSIINDFIYEVELYYGKKVIIYSLYDAYDLFIKNSYLENPIWIRDTFSKPILSDNRNWIIWQFSDKIKLNGYKGEEPFIDMNVFNGSDEEFKKFLNQAKITNY